MKDQVEANAGYAEIKKKDDLVGLLKLVKILSHQFAVNRSLEESLDDATLQMMLYQQGDDVSVSEHIRNVKNLCQVLEHYGGWFLNDKVLIKAERKKDQEKKRTTKSTEEYRKIVRNKTAALRALKSTRHKSSKGN